VNGIVYPCTEYGVGGLNHFGSPRTIRLYTCWVCVCVCVNCAVCDFEFLRIVIVHRI